MRALAELAKKRPELAAEAEQAAFAVLETLVHGIGGPEVASDLSDLLRGISRDCVDLGSISDPAVASTLEAELDSQVDAIMGLVERRLDRARAELIRRAVKVLRTTVVPVIVKSALGAL